MNRVIYVKTSIRELLRQEFHVSSATISDALNFKRANKRASMIRSSAVNNHKGILIDT